MTDPRLSHAVQRALYSGAASKLAILAITVASTAIAARSLTPQEFGVALIAMSLSVVLGTLDFGFGIGLISPISASVARGDEEPARAHIANSLVPMLCIGASIAVLGPLATYTVPDSLLFRADGVSDGEVRGSIAVMCLAVGVAIPAMIGTRICLVRQLTTANALFPLLAGAAGLASTAVCAVLHTGPTAFVISTLLVPTFVLAWQAIFYLNVSQFRLQPLWHAVDWRSIRAIFVDSIPYAILAATAAFQTALSPVLLGYALDPRTAGVLAVAMRMFSWLPQLIANGLQQSWAVTAKALALGDSAWVRRNFWWMLKVTGLPALAICVLLVALGPEIATLWVGPELAPSRFVLSAVALGTIYVVTMSQVGTILNANGIVKLASGLAVISVTLSIPASIYFAHVLGAAGPPLATFLIGFPIASVPQILICRRLLADRTLPQSPLSELQR